MHSEEVLTATRAAPCLFVLSEKMSCVSVSQVRFIDYGDRTLIGREDLQILEPVHQRLPAQAVTCQLAGIEAEEWTPAANADFQGV